MAKNSLLQAVEANSVSRVKHILAGRKVNKEDYKKSLEYAGGHIDQPHQAEIKDLLLKFEF